MPYDFNDGWDELTDFIEKYKLYPVEDTEEDS